MVLLQYLVPVLATLLLGILGGLNLQNVTTQIQYAWQTLFIVFVLTLIFDRSRGNWISYIVFLLAATFTAGLYMENTLGFLAWGSCLFLAVSTVIVLSQLAVSKLFRFLLITIAIALSLLPAAMSASLFFPDENAWIIPISALVVGILPFTIQYFRVVRPEIVWPLISIQQFILRLSFVAWIFRWKPVLISTDIAGMFREPMAITLGALLIISNIKPSKLSWAHISLTMYTLVILFVSLFKNHEVLEYIYVLIGITAFGAIVPIQKYTTEKRGSDLSALEVGALGSASFLFVLWIIYKMKTSFELYEFVLWSAFIILVSSKVWSQSDREQIFGKISVVNSRAYFYGRIFIQTIAILYFVGMLLNQKLHIYNI